MSTTNTTNQRPAGATSPATMTHAEALSRAAKCLRLAAQSTNPGEAANAAAKAQRIMDLYKLSASDISIDSSVPVEPIIHCPQDPLDVDGSARWKGQLAMVITKLNQCKVYGGSGGYCLIGRPSDMQAVRYLYSWLTKEIERLAASHCAGCGRTYWNNFRLGAVETVSAKLRDSARQTVSAARVEASGSGSSALLVLDKSLAFIEATEKEVERYGKEHLHLRSRSSSSRFNSDARAEGWRAGNSINIGNRSALGGGNLRLS